MGTVRSAVMRNTLLAGSSHMVRKGNYEHITATGNLWTFMS